MLKIKNLNCQKGYNLLFENLSITINYGDILRITGANGCGKTSLLKIIAGINSIENGSIIFNNDSVKSNEYQQEIFYLGHQSFLSGELSVIKNLQFLARLNKTKEQNLTQALKNIGLDGYENEICSTLSAGQKRRVILATLFSSKAKIWLLDEPFTALDPTGVRVVEGLIQNHCNNKGICLFTTHQDANLENQKILPL